MCLIVHLCAKQVKLQPLFPMSNSMVIINEKQYGEGCEGILMIALYLHVQNPYVLQKT